MNKKASNDILVVVHPGSACGSANFNLGTQEASQARASLVDELERWAGAVVVIDGGLSDELGDYPALKNALTDALKRAHISGAMSLRVEGEDPEQEDRIQEVIESMAPGLQAEAVFHVTGAWLDHQSGGGCVGGVVEKIRALGCTAVVCDSAIEIEPEDGLEENLSSRKMSP